MEISFLGKTALKIKTKNLTLEIDPISNRDRADAVIYSNSVPVISVAGSVAREKVFVIDKEGEYELAGVGMIVGADEVNGKKVLIPIVTVDGVSLAYLGGITGKLSDGQVEKLSELADVLVVPLANAVNLIEQIQPYIALLVGYESTEELEKFLAANKFETVRRDLDKIKIDSENLPENTEVVVLNA